MKPTRTQIWSTGAAVTTLVLLGLLWTNRYSYSQWVDGSMSFPVRTSRLTGESERLTIREGWVRMGPWKGSAGGSEGSRLPAEELAKVRILRMVYASASSVTGEIYNGSRYQLRQVTVRMTQELGGRITLSRALEGYVGIAPSYTGQFSEKVYGVSSEEGLEFSIESATGEQKQFGADASASSSAATEIDKAIRAGGNQPADTPPTVVDLGRYLKDVNPGKYDAYSDAELGRFLRDFLPQEFGDALDLEPSTATVDPLAASERP